MKKLLVLSALLGLLALPAFSADVSFGGDLSFGFITDFSEEAETNAVTIDMKGSVDDYNSVDIRWSPLDAAADALPEKAAITTDVGAWLDLPVGVTLQWGWDDPDWNWFGDISKFEKEAYSATPEMGNYWGLLAKVSFGMFELALAGNPGGPDNAGDTGDFLAGVAVKEAIPGLNAELYLYQGGGAVDAWDAMVITFGAGYAGSFGDLDLGVGVNFQYDMDETVPVAGPAWQYGLAVTGGYSIAYVDVELNGNDTDALNRVYLYASVAPIDLVTIFADFELSLADGPEAFQGAEFGLEFETGATWWSVGYQINNEAFENLNSPYAEDGTAPLVAADGGLFFNWDINY